MKHQLTGKKAIVTGARGLALSMADALAEAGAKVVIIRQSSQTVCPYPYVQADLSIRTEQRRGFYEALELLGGSVDILVNSAGVQRRHDIEIFPEEDWDLVLEVNLSAMFFLCKLAGTEMLKKGYGKIINIASMQTFFGGVRIPAYASSKGGVGQLTKALAVAWASKGINVNALAPGYMNTEMNDALIKDPVRSKSILSRIPANRWGEPSDMAGPCVFLASDVSSYINGAIIPVDGGYMCS